MRKFILSSMYIVMLTLMIACGGGGEEQEAVNENNEATSVDGEGMETLVVGASNIPHAKILEKASPLLEEKGIDLVIETFQDYVLPNTALDEGDLDANYFQHVPYLELQIKEHGFDFVDAGGIHIEPIGVYSKKHESLEEIPEGGQILMGNSVANHGRILSLLERENLIKLEDGVDRTKATIEDIVENPKDLKFNYEFEESYLPQVYENDEGDAVLINSNYALDVGLNPMEDSIAIEDADSPYVNVIVVRAGDEDKEKIKTLVEVLRSPEIQNFIIDEWNGAVVPVTK